MAQQAPAPIERRAPGVSSMQPPSAQSNSSIQAQLKRQQNQNSQVRGEHLAEWYNQHSNLTPEQQRQALQREPGFRELPLATQQRLLNRLQQLDSMNPRQRQHWVDGTELAEHWTPEQSQQLNGALRQLGSLPPDQRVLVSRIFVTLRNMPPGQRMEALNSGRFGPPLNGYERDVVIHLLQVEPLIPRYPLRMHGQQP